MASPVVLSFSGGKDSVLALERLRAGGWDVRALLAAVVEDDGTLVMHGVPERLVALQAASLGVPLVPFRVPREAANTVYEARLAAALEPFRAQGVRHVAFGDLFLEDIRAYRDALMARLGFEPVYPLWHEDTRALAERFVDAGYRGVAICVDTARARAGVGRPRAGRGLLRRAAGRHGPVRRERRVPHLRLRRARVLLPGQVRAHDRAQAREVCLRGAAPPLGRSLRALRRNVRVRDEGGGRALLVRGSPAHRAERGLRELPLPPLPARRNRDAGRCYPLSPGLSAWPGRERPRGPGLPP